MRQAAAAGFVTRPGSHHAAVRTLAQRRRHRVRGQRASASQMSLVLRNRMPCPSCLPDDQPTIHCSSSDPALPLTPVCPLTDPSLLCYSQSSELGATSDASALRQSACVSPAGLRPSVGMARTHACSMAEHRPVAGRYGGAGRGHRRKAAPMGGLLPLKRTTSKVKTDPGHCSSTPMVVFGSLTTPTSSVACDGAQRNLSSTD